jgi:hypothetical protein
LSAGQLLGRGVIPGIIGRPLNDLLERASADAAEAIDRALGLLAGTEADLKGAARALAEHTRPR